MKLLGWMHSRLKQKGNEPVNNSTTIVGNCITSFTDHKKVKNNNGAEMAFQEEQFDEIFPGFLAIGTLGNNIDPPTPSFPVPFVHAETDITDKEIKFTNEEKVSEVAYEPSERTIALSDEHIETGAIECYGNMEECPLQKYLFGSSVELSEMEYEVLRMFHRKVHPVNENNLQDNETNNISCKADNPGASSEVNKKNSPAATPKKEVISREQWIKTDSDYLVLEL